MNDTYPSRTPEELVHLTYEEGMFIAQITTCMRVHMKPSGSVNYNGHTINLHQDTTEIVKVLPRLPKDVSVILVRRKGKMTNLQTSKFVAMQCRVGSTICKENNPAYKDIEIDQERLDALPVNGNVPFREVKIEDISFTEKRKKSKKSKTTLDVAAAPSLDLSHGSVSVTDSNDEKFNETLSTTLDCVHSSFSDDGIDDHKHDIDTEENVNEHKEDIAFDAGPTTDELPSDGIYETFVPSSNHPQSQEDYIKGYLNGEKTLSWGTNGDPIDEYHTEYFYSKAFPTLFPDGNGDISGPKYLRKVDVTVTEFFTYLMQYGYYDEDGAPVASIRVS